MSRERTKRFIVVVVYEKKKKIIINKRPKTVYVMCMCVCVRTHTHIYIYILCRFEDRFTFYDEIVADPFVFAHVPEVP